MGGVGGDGAEKQRDMVIRSSEAPAPPGSAVRAEGQPAGPAAARLVSVVVPVFNEAESLSALLTGLLAALSRVGAPFEIIAVNDGSSDRSMEVLRGLAAVTPELKIIDFRRNYGQTAALMAGIDHAGGDIIVAIDADLQNDPDDIPALLDKINEGYDVVSGWRRDRKDAPWRRNLVSRWANKLISKISGVRLNDYGCTLKAYRAETMCGMRLYGEMHRFIPIYASWMGARVTEIPVRHYPRQFGYSKYGLERVVKVILDLIVVCFLDKYFVKPIYIFGGFGMLSLLISVCSFLLILYFKFFESISMISTPLPLLTVMTFLVGIVSILMGLIAEMLVRTYFESQGRSTYLVGELINFERSDAA
jgi:dolichol-phosphate mannosyltransferase